MGQLANFGGLFFLFKTLISTIVEHIENPKLLERIASEVSISSEDGLEQLKSDLNLLAFTKQLYKIKATLAVLIGNDFKKIFEV